MRCRRTFKKTRVDDRARFIWLWLSGMSFRAIAKCRGTSATTVRRWVRRWLGRDLRLTDVTATTNIYIRDNIPATQDMKIGNGPEKPSRDLYSYADFVNAFNPTGSRSSIFYRSHPMNKYPCHEIVGRSLPAAINYYISYIMWMYDNFQ